MKNVLTRWIRRLASSRTDDADLAQRGYILGLLLLGTSAAAIILIVIRIAKILGGDLSAGLQTRLLGELALLPVLVIALRLNQIGRTRLASYTFIILTIVGNFTLSVLEDVDRAAILYLIPIAAASFFTRPHDSFIFAAISSMCHVAAFYIRPDAAGFNNLAPISFFLSALLAWQVSTSLNQALHKVRLYAHELDCRVAERTRDLNNALDRARTEADKVQAILRSMSEGIIVFDQNNQAILVNPAACSILGQEEEDLLGSDWLTLLGNCLSQEDQSIVRMLRAGSGPWQASFKATCDGQTLVISFAPIRPALWNQQGTLAVLRDITQEAQVVQMKSELMSTLSHELCSPMAAVKGYVDLLASGVAGAVTDMQHDFLQIVQANTDQLSAAVNEMLDMACIEAGQAAMHFEAVSLRHIVLRAAQNMQPHFDEKGIALNLDIPEELPDVLADADRLAQIINHLLSNALKYTRQGRVDITARVVEGQVRVDVADTGIGISEQDQARLFTSFFRAPGVRELAPGIGLGLAITRALVELHGGRIWVRSAVGQGSTFSFTLPVFPTALAGAPSSAVSVTEMTEPRSPKILVVDSELPVAQTFRLQLEKANYDVLIATKATKALQIAEHEKPDLILLDATMPEVDGFEILQQLRQNPATQSIPVVITSSIPERDTALALGASDCLVKPVRESQLVTSVRRVLSQAESKTLGSVLVIEDDAEARRWLTLMLSGQGLTVHEAQDCQQALAAVNAHLPNVIVLGLKMTQDGWTVVRKIRENPKTVNIPIIWLTASQVDLQYDRTRALGLGIQRVFTKPVSAAMLVREIKRLTAT